MALLTACEVAGKVLNERLARADARVRDKATISRQSGESEGVKLMTGGLGNHFLF